MLPNSLINPAKASFQSFFFFLFPTDSLRVLLLVDRHHPGRRRRVGPVSGRSREVRQVDEQALARHDQVFLDCHGELPWNLKLSL